MENLREKIIQRLTEDGAVQLFEVFVWWKEATRRDDSDKLDLQYVTGTAVNLGLAEWVQVERPDLKEPNEPGPSMAAASYRKRTALNAKLKWVVDLHSPAQLGTLPKKMPHSGNYAWLGSEKFGFPEYLWDSELSETVLATPERLQVGYIAISYTWGRFKERYDRVNGTPWNVPVIKPNVCANMLDKLKDIMARIPASRYFWVDVLCINQEDMILKKAEIAKQAAIFGNAKACLGYLWSLDFEDDLAHIMSNFGDQLLWSLLNGVKRLPPHIQEKLDGKLRLDPWFTSLWALQEMVLSPEQIWMTRSGSFCSVNGSIVSSRFFAQALRVMNWALGFRQRIWDFAFFGEFPLLEKLEAAIAGGNIVSQHRTKQCEAQKLWEESVMGSERDAAELRVKGIRILDVTVGRDHNVRILPECMQERQADEIVSSKALKRWMDWGFGEACLNLSLEASRSAIIVAGANRHTSKPRVEAMLAALKIGKSLEQEDTNKDLTPGALPGWLQQILVDNESSIYFYVSHSWRTSSEHREESSPLFVRHDPWQAYDHVQDYSAPIVSATISSYLTGMLPSMGTRSFLPTDFTLTHHSAYKMQAWHIHDGVMHIPYGAVIQDIRSRDNAGITIWTNGPEFEINKNLADAVHAVQKLDYVKDSLGRCCRVIFLPLLFIGDPLAGLPYGKSHTLTSTGPNPVVRGIVLVSRPSSKRHHSMTFWSKAGLYSATLCRVKRLEWQDGILVGSASEESAVSRNKELCLRYLPNEPDFWGPKVKKRLFDFD